MAAELGHDDRAVSRLLTLAAIYDDTTRTGAAVIGGVTVQIVRDWVAKLNAHGPASLIDEHRRALAVAIEDGPIPAVHGVVRWRVIDLCQRLWDGYAVRVSKQTLSRELRALSYPPALGSTARA